MVKYFDINLTTIVKDLVPALIYGIKLFFFLMPKKMTLLMFFLSLKNKLIANSKVYTIV
jgi:hypothetical protein